MEIVIDSKSYKKDELIFIDSVNDTTSDEFIYYCETLYRAPDKEYILQTSWMINPQWFKGEELSKEALLPKTEFQIIPPEEAESFLDMAVWEV